MYWLNKELQCGVIGCVKVYKVWLLHVSFKEGSWLMIETAAPSFQEQVLHVCCFFFFWLCFLLRTIRMKAELLEYHKQGSASIIQKQQWGEICPFQLLTWRLFLWRSCCWCAVLRVRNFLIQSLFNLSRKGNWKETQFWAVGGCDLVFSAHALLLCLR